MKKQDIQEIEFKWTIFSAKTGEAFFRHAEKLGAHLSPSQKLQIHDYYLDTPDRLFGSCRTSCRLRHENNRWELTLKAQSRLKGGLAKRREKTYPLPSTKSYGDATKYCQERLLKSILGYRKLNKLFEIHNNRIARSVILPDNTRAQICVDDVKIIKLDQVIPLREIELEFLKGSLRSLNSFCRAMTRNLLLKRAKISKVATALKTLSLEIPELVRRVYLFSRYDRLSYAACQITKKHLEALKFNEPGVRVGMDEEFVHDMRVSARRLRAVIRIFEEMMPQNAEKIFKDLVWIGHLLGDLRELQLHRQFISNHKKKLPLRQQKLLEKYELFCATKIDETHHLLASALNSKRYKSLLNSLTKLSQILNSPKQIKEGAKELIQTALNRVLKISRGINKNSSDKHLHQLRISIKKLRYTCEFFRQIASPVMHLFIKKTIQLQDILGEIQDALTDIHMFSSMASKVRVKSNIRKDLGKILNQLIDFKQKVFKEAHRNFFKKWKKFKTQKNLSVLEKVL